MVTIHQVRSALLWDITQRWVVVLYRRFGTSYRSHLQGSRTPNGLRYPCGKEPRYPITEGVGCALEVMCTFWRKKYFAPYRQSDDSSFCSHEEMEISTRRIWWTCSLAGPLRAGSGPDDIFFRAPSKVTTAKNLYTKSERLTLSCRVTWAWPQRVNLYNRQLVVVPRKTKTYAT